jgi:hypothetical protein
MKMMLVEPAFTKMSLATRRHYAAARLTERHHRPRGSISLSLLSIKVGKMS